MDIVGPHVAKSLICETLYLETKNAEGSTPVNTFYKDRWRRRTWEMLRKMQLGE